MDKERFVERTRLALSYLCELVLLPSHCLRMAQIRFAARRTEYEVAESLAAELSALRQAVNAAEAMENEVGRADRAWTSARRSAQDLLDDSVTRLLAKVAAILGVDRSRNSPNRGGKGQTKLKGTPGGAAGSLVAVIMIGLALVIAMLIVGAISVGRAVVRADSWPLRTALFIPPALLGLAAMTHSVGVAASAILVGIVILVAAYIKRAILLGQVALPDFAVPDFEGLRR